MANKLFSMLVAAEQVVVLLDEFDELGRERSGNENLLSRFITTAMLPKLAAINKERKIVFLLATNHVTSFDAAFRRGGRFDMVLQVLQPTLAAKLRHQPWAHVLSRSLNALSGAAKSRARKQIHELTFLETKNLVRDLSQKKRPSEISKIIDTAWSTCTLVKPTRAQSDVDSVSTLPGEEEAGSANRAVSWPGPSPDDPNFWRGTCNREALEMRLPPLGLRT